VLLNKLIYSKGKRGQNFRFNPQLVYSINLLLELCSSCRSAIDTIDNLSYMFIAFYKNIINI